MQHGQLPNRSKVGGLRINMGQERRYRLWSCNSQDNIRCGSLVSLAKELNKVVLTIVQNLLA